MISDPTGFSFKSDRQLYIIFGVTLVMVMGVASLTPAFPKIARELGLSETQVALLISVFTLPGIFLAPLAGVLGDRFGRKTVLVPSLFLFAFAGFACFFSRNFYLLLSFRFIQGIGASSLGALNMALIADFYSGRNRGTAMGCNASVLSLGTASYPFIGGLLAGMAWYAPFVLPLAAIPVALGLIFYIDEPETQQKQSLAEYLQNAWQSIRQKEVIGLFLISIFTFVILYGAFLSYFPFLLNQKFALGAPQIGFVFSLSSISTAITAAQLGKLLKRFSEVFLIKIAFILYLVVSILIPNLSNLYILIIPVVLFGIAQGINIPGLQTLLANLAPDNQRAIFLSINAMVLRIGQTVGPVFIGMGYALSGIDGAFYLAGVVAIIVFISIFFLLKNLEGAVK